MMTSAELVREKLDQAADVLREMDIDLWLTLARETTLMPDPALELIAGLDVTWNSAFIVSRDGFHSAVVGYFDAANVQALGGYDRIVAYHRGIGSHLAETLDWYQPRRIAVNYSADDVAADGLTHGNYLNLLNYLEGTPYAKRLVSAEAVIGAVRGRKTAGEVALIRQAVATTEQLFDEVEGFARPGMTQRQIAQFVHRRIAELDLAYAWPKPFNPIVTCGPDSAVGHAAPGDVPLQVGHLLHMDLGVKQAGYCSDIQRMWYVLSDDEESAPPDVQRAFDTVLSAIQAGEAALRPGTPGYEVDAAARGVIVEAGYPEYMHALGHLLGRTAHDGATTLAPRWERYTGTCERLVEVGNVFTLELHVPVPERGIMSLEEDVLVTADGVEYLSRPQRTLRYLRP